MTNFASNIKPFGKFRKLKISSVKSGLLEADNTGNIIKSSVNITNGTLTTGSINVSGVSTLNDLIINGTTDLKYETRTISGGTISEPSTTLVYVNNAGGTEPNLTTITTTLETTSRKLILTTQTPTVTVKEGGNINLSNGVDFVMTSHDRLTLLKATNNEWYEESRSIYTISTIPSLQNTLDAKLVQNEAVISTDKVETDEVKLNDKQSIKGQSGGDVFDIVLPSTQGVKGDIPTLNNSLNLEYKKPLYKSRYSLTLDDMPILSQNNLLTIGGKDGTPTMFYFKNETTVTGFFIETDSLHGINSSTGSILVSYHKNSDLPIASVLIPTSNWFNHPNPSGTTSTSSSFQYTYHIINETYSDGDYLHVSLNLGGTSMTSGGWFSATICVVKPVEYSS